MPRAYQMIREVLAHLSSRDHVGMKRLIEKYYMHAGSSVRRARLMSVHISPTYSSSHAVKFSSYASIGCKIAPLAAIDDATPAQLPGVGNSCAPPRITSQSNQIPSINRAPYTLYAANTISILTIV